jgi:hypothetical protein
MAQPNPVRSAPVAVLLTGLLDSDPVFWLFEPIGDRSEPCAAVDGVVGLSPEPSDDGLEGLLVGLDPGKAVPDEFAPVGAVSRPAVNPLEPCPASPESLPLEPEPPEPVSPESLVLELAFPEPAKPESLELELPPFEPATLVSLVLEFVVPEPASPASLALEPLPFEPARPVSLPLEFPVPEFAKPLLPALEFGEAAFEAVGPRSAVLEPEPLEAVGRVSLLVLLPGRLAVVLSPPPAPVLGAALADWLGREASAVEAAFTGVPEGLESRLEVVLWLLEGPPVSASGTERPGALGALVSSPELAVPPTAKPLVSGARLALATPPDLTGLPESDGCAALERTLASCKRSVPEVAAPEERAMAASVAPLEPTAPLEAALSFSELPVLVTFERNKFGLVELELRLGKFANCCPGLGASNGERCCNFITCEEFGFINPTGGLRL